MGYVELADFHEIWPELSLSIEEQKGVGDFLYHGYFCCDLSLIILDITKPHPIIVKKNWYKAGIQFILETAYLMKSFIC